MFGPQNQICQSLRSFVFYTKLNTYIFKSAIHVIIYMYSLGLAVLGVPTDRDLNFQMDYC